MNTSSPEKHLNIIVVDDEYDACKNLVKTLNECVGVEINILDVAHNTIDAEKQIIEQKPDVVFLDIEMPNENAFDFLDRIRPINFEIIFVTAYDEYAIKAFKLNAVDYILKPISPDEVATAVRKAKDRLLYKSVVQSHPLYGDFYNDIKNRTKLDKIKLKDNTNFDIVDFKDILYIEAKGSYSNVRFLKDSVTEKSIITSSSLNEYEELFPDDFFCRIHRSYLVNCMHIKKVIAGDNPFVVMKNQLKLAVSRRRVSELMSFFKNEKH